MMFLLTVFIYTLHFALQFYFGKVGANLQQEESGHSCGVIKPKEFKKTRLSMSPWKNHCGDRKGECFVKCLHMSLCHSFVVAKTNNCSSLCLFYTEASLNDDSFLSDEEATYYFLESQSGCCGVRCQNNGLCDGKSCKCSCTKEYTSTGCVCPSKNTSRQFDSPGKQISGDVVQLDVGVHIWALTNTHKILMQNLQQSPGSWSEIPGGLIHVTSGSSGVWGVNAAHNIFFREGVSDLKPQGNTWKHIYGGLKQIDSGNFGVVYGVNVHDNLYCMSGITKTSPSGGSWIYIPGVELKYVSCGEYGCWGIRPDNTVAFRDGVTAENCAGNAWLQVDGSFIELDSGVTGSVYAISPEYELYRRLGICAGNPIGEKWLKVQEGRFKHVTVGQGNLITLAENGTITIFS